jgi:transposase
MYYAGLDMHQKFIYATIKDKKGKIIRQMKATNSFVGLDTLFKGFKRNQLKAVLESCGIWEDIYFELGRRCKEVCLANPQKVKAIASAKLKNDKVDSEILADLLRGNLIPKSYIPPQHIRELRNLIRHRQGLVKIRTMLKNRVHAILRRKGIQSPFKDIFVVRGRQFLKKLNEPQINTYIRIIENLEKELKEITQYRPQDKTLSKYIELLKTMDGIGNVSSLIIASEIGDIKRFSSPRKLCSYAGIVPSQNQSAEKDYRGRITKQGSKWLRWIMIQCALIAIKIPGKFQNYYYKLKKKKHHNVAITALARKMLYIIWHMLYYNKPYLHDH